MEESHLHKITCTCFLIVLSLILCLFYLMIFLSGGAVTGINGFTHQPTNMHPFSEKELLFLSEKTDKVIINVFEYFDFYNFPPLNFN